MMGRLHTYLGDLPKTALGGALVGGGGAGEDSGLELEVPTTLQAAVILAVSVAGTVDVAMEINAATKLDVSDSVLTPDVFSAVAGQTLLSTLRSGVTSIAKNANQLFPLDEGVWAPPVPLVVPGGSFFCVFTRTPTQAPRIGLMFAEIPLT